MSCVNPDEPKKRQLPQWMLGVQASNPVSGPESQAKVKVGETRGRNLKSRVEAEKHDTKPLSCEGESKKVNSQILEVKKGGRRSKKRPVTEDKLSDGDTNENDKKKENIASMKKRKAKALKGASDGRESEESTFSEEELTVEDLVSIAKEIIKNAKKDEEPSSRMTDKLQVSSLPTSFSGAEQLHNQSADHFDEGSNNLIRTLSNSAASASDFMENQPSNTKSTTTRSFVETGDAAQDMLEILLGPLLRKSKASERRTDQLLPTMETTFDCYQGDKQKQDEVVEDTLTKKKSSLKDKVTMLLN